MKTTTHSRHHARARRGIQTRIATVLLLAGAVLLISPCWTEHAWAQQKLARIGILTFASVADEPVFEDWVGIFRDNLASQGWIEGNNVAFEYQSANSDPAQIAEAAAALAAVKVDVIFATSAPLVRAAFAATRTIPIVAVDYTTDPVAEGYAGSYARPGSNVTGIFLDAPEFAGKWFELLQAIVPGLSHVSVLWDPAPGANHLQAVRAVARLLNIELHVFEVRKPDDLDTAFDAMRGRPQAVILLPSPMIYGQSPRLARLALQHRLPAISMATQFANAGGILAYGPENTLTAERIGGLVAKILSGAKPAEIPVERPIKFQLVVNFKTAKALSLTIPQSILLRADEVIR